MMFTMGMLYQLSYIGIFVLKGAFASYYAKRSFSIESHISSLNFLLLK